MQSTSVLMKFINYSNAEEVYSKPIYMTRFVKKTHNNWNSWFKINIHSIYSQMYALAKFKLCAYKKWLYLTKTITFRVTICYLSESWIKTLCSHTLVTCISTIKPLLMWHTQSKSTAFGWQQLWASNGTPVHYQVLQVSNGKSS